MYKSLKQLKITFTTLSLLVLIAISFILFIAQAAFAQTTDHPLSEVARPAVTAMPLIAASTTASVRSMAPEALAEARARFEAMHADLAAKIAERRDERATMIAEIQARRDAHKAALAADVQTRVSTFAEHAATGLTGMITRLSTISAQLRIRTDAMAAAGTDVSSVTDTLDSIDALLRDAGSALSGIDIDIEYVVTSPNPTTDWAAARDQLIEIRTTVVEARDLLKDAVMALRALQTQS
jgi:hypothetical protein